MDSPARHDPPAEGELASGTLQHPQAHVPRCEQGHHRLSTESPPPAPTAQGKVMAQEAELNDLKRRQGGSGLTS